MYFVLSKLEKALFFGEKQSIFGRYFPEGNNEKWLESWTYQETSHFLIGRGRRT